MKLAFKKNKLSVEELNEFKLRYNSKEVDDMTTISEAWNNALDGTIFLINSKDKESIYDFLKGKSITGHFYN